MVKISSVTLLDRKDGTGKFARIEFADLSTGKRASRAYHASFADLCAKGDNAEGIEVKQVDCPEYTVEATADREGFTTNKRSIAILKGESEAVALAKSQPSSVNEAADVTV